MEQIYNKEPYLNENISNDNFIKIPNYFHLLIPAAFYFMIAQALIQNSNVLMNITIIAIFCYYVISNAENCFYMLCGTSMFETVFKINGDVVWFILLLVLMFKLLMREKFRANVRAIVTCALIIFIELLGDLFIGSMGQLLVNLVTIIFVFVTFSKIDLFHLDAFRIIWTLIAAFSAIIYYLLSMYGGMGEFISSFMASTYAYRFGHSYGDTVGGAMAIPLYTTMIISCGLTYYLHSPKMQLHQKVIISISVIISIVFGAMTISRSFYLGFIVTLASIVIFKVSKNKHIKWIILFFCVMAIFILLSSKSDLISKIFSNLKFRMDNGVKAGSEGRTDIWISCIEYLLTNPLYFLFGMGSTNYVNIGSESGKLFSAGAHNLFLDFLMSWGVIGLLGMMLFLVYIYKKQIKQNTEFSKQTIIPLITYLIFSMTALRSCSLKTWVFMLIAYVFIDDTIYSHERGKI